MPRGGPRPNSGPKKGTKYAKTLEREVYRQQLAKLVLEELRPMTEAQIAQAKGIKYLVTREKKSGKFIRVTEAMAKVHKGNADEEIIEVWEKDPSTFAYTDLMNRVMGKPIEQQEIQHSGEIAYRWMGDGDRG